MPFRSEAEQIREQVRRLDEQARTLSEENAALERQSDRPRRRLKWSIAIGACVLLSSAINCGIGALGAARAAENEDRIRASNASVELSLEQKNRRDCNKMNEVALEDLTSCRRDLELARLAVRPRPSQDDHSFSRAAATQALSELLPRITACIKPQRDISFHTTATFAPTGNVDAAIIDSTVDLSDAESKCVVATLRSMKVPSFDGGAVTVGKSWGISKQR